MNMNFRFLFFVFLHLFLAPSLYAKTHYPLVDDPIDVVIVTHPKDQKTLDACIEGIKKNCSSIRRCIVVSSIPLTDQAEWFDENLFPFSKEDVAMAVVGGNAVKRAMFFLHTHYSPGWYFQQLLKFYSPFVIPGISSNVLVIDSDTIFLNPVSFLNSSYGALFCVGNKRIMKAYFAHAKRLVPGYRRVHPEFYSVCHHMLFQRPILEDLFQTVEQYHQTEFWKAFCACANQRENKGASEYEIYYSFALSHTNQVQIRPLKWQNSSHLNRKNAYQRQGYHFVSFHTYMRP